MSEMLVISGGKKSGKPKVELSEEELNSAMNFEKFELEMQSALDHLKNEYIEQLSVRSAPGKLLWNIDIIMW